MEKNCPVLIIMADALVTKGNNTVHVFGSVISLHMYYTFKLIANR